MIKWKSTKKIKKYFPLTFLCSSLPKKWVCFYISLRQNEQFQAEWRIVFFPRCCPIPQVVHRVSKHALLAHYRHFVGLDKGREDPVDYHYQLFLPFPSCPNHGLKSHYVEFLEIECSPKIIPFFQLSPTVTIAIFLAHYRRCGGNDVCPNLHFFNHWRYRWNLQLAHPCVRKFTS